MIPGIDDLGKKLDELNKNLVELNENLEAIEDVKDALDGISDRIGDLIEELKKIRGQLPEGGGNSVVGAIGTLGNAAANMFMKRGVRRPVR